MGHPQNNSSGAGVSRIVLSVAAAAGLFAVLAAVPCASTGKESGAVKILKVATPHGETAAEMRPLAQGPAIRIGRAFDADDEDCTLAVTRTKDENGRIKMKRDLICVN
jgi:hypothetical protein